MNKLLSLNIPLGFNIIQKVEETDLWQAEKYLMSRRAKRYVKAVRDNDKIYLYAQYLVCPYCRKEFVINENTFFAHFNKKNKMNLKSLISNDDVREFTSRYISLFEYDRKRELTINPVMSAPELFDCPDCKNRSYHIDTVRKVEIALKNKKIAVKCEMVSGNEFLSCKWIESEKHRITFPMFEVVTFDLAKGRVNARLEDEKGNKLYYRDITSLPELLKGGAVYNILTKNKLVMRNVKRMFSAIWTETLPFSGRMIGIEELFKMTRFVGYPATFYDAVPFLEESYMIDRSFSYIVKKLHCANNINEIFRSFSIPDKKSIRRIMFNDPGLLFYISEIASLSDIFVDLNVICRFLKNRNIYEILSSIHQRHGILLYIRDYCSIKGAVNTIVQIENDWEYIRSKAISYASLNHEIQKEIQKDWKKKQKEQRMVWYIPEYSIPVRHSGKRIKDCIIDGYSFVLLKNSNEYMQASKQLSNCIKECKRYPASIVCVRSNDKYIAAIEVEDDCVIQAKGYNNEVLSNDYYLYVAFCKWATLNRLSICDEEEYC